MTSTLNRVACMTTVLVALSCLAGTASADPVSINPTGNAYCAEDPCVAVSGTGTATCNSPNCVAVSALGYARAGCTESGNDVTCHNPACADIDIVCLTVAVGGDTNRPSDGYAVPCQDHQICIGADVSPTRQMVCVIPPTGLLRSETGSPICYGVV